MRLFDGNYTRFTKLQGEYEEALNNISTQQAVKSAYEAAVRGCDLGVLTRLESNYRELLPWTDEELQRRRDNVSRQVDRQLDRVYQEFLGDLGLDWLYGKVDDKEEIEHYIDVAMEMKEHFAESRNAGLYWRFIEAMKQEIIKEAKPHKDTIEQRLKNLEYELHNELNESDILENKYPLITEIHRQLNLDNLTVAEDYLNRWNETGGQIEMIDSNEFRNEAFEGLLQEYEYIYSACSKGKGESLMRIRARLKNTKGSMTGKATDIIKT